MTEQPKKPLPEIHITGQRGEKAAAGAAKARGWQIAAQNRRFAGGEADILGLRVRDGRKQGLVLEVKTTQSAEDDLHTRLSAAQKRRLFRMAEAWVQERSLDEGHVALALVRLQDNREELTWIDLDRW